MRIVPRQCEADDEVIAFWIKKTSLARDEIAALAAGINPFAWEEYHGSNRFSDEALAASLKAVPNEKWQAVRDILIVLKHRADASSFKEHTLRDWVLIFEKCNLHFPEKLIPPVSERVKKAVEKSRNPEFLNELETLWEEMESRRGVPILLSKWFLHDTWAADEALMLLVGLCPDGTLIEQYKTIDGDVMSRIEIAYSLDGYESMPYSFAQEFEDGEEVCGLLDRMSTTWRHLAALWESGQHPEKNAPSYYIAWAKAKKYDIPWLSWAEENGLLGDVISQDPKPLTTKQSTSLLTIIYLLAEEAGIDWKKSSKAAQLIVAKADALGIQIGQRTVEEYLKQIPIALERKGR